ncbi:MAG TPA: cyclic nucleotide-binding domain-containing protein [Polyangia bacterium]|nr:cyclic nucleotide-binding domain-containing protein [Polyangia bacterium]
MSRDVKQPGSPETPATPPGTIEAAGPETEDLVKALADELDAKLGEQAAAPEAVVPPVKTKPLPEPTAPPKAPAAPPPPATSAAAPVGEVADLLAQINIFAGLQPAYLKRIAAVGLREKYEADAVIFSEGAAGEKMYLILNGAVRISRQVPGMGEEALAVLRAGHYFGEMSLVDDSPRSADARAHEATELLVLKKEDLEDLLFVDRDLAYDLLWNFVRTLTSRLRDTNDKMTFLAVTNRF